MKVTVRCCKWLCDFADYPELQEEERAQPLELNPETMSLIPQIGHCAGAEGVRRFHAIITVDGAAAGKIGASFVAS